MSRTWPLLALPALVACAPLPSTRWSPPSDFTLTVIDDPAQRQFALTLTSRTDAALCLSREAWPASAGLPPGFDGASLNTDSDTRDLVSTGSAYCPGGCGEVRVEPGQTLPGVVPYSAFGDAEVIAAESGRTLEFDVHPYVCSD